MVQMTFNLKKILTFLIIFLFIFLTTSTFYAKPLDENIHLLSSETIIDLIKQINESRLTYYFKQLLSFGVRYTGTENCTRAGDWLYQEFKHMNLSVEYHDWSLKGYTSRNIVATLPGSNQESSAEFILCAHYDTVINSPGANDDGSGIVAVLTIAEILSKYSFNHTIRFIAFSGEEVGTYGSFSYAKKAYERGDNIIAVLNLDIIGYAETSHGGRILRFFHEDPSEWIAGFAENSAMKYKDIVDIYIESLPSYPGADNQAFVDYGYGGVWIAQHDANSVGHSPNDTFDHINITYQKKVTQIMLAVLSELANKPIPIQAIIRSPLEAKGYIQDKPVIDLFIIDQYFHRLRAITIVVGRPLAQVDVLSNDPIEYVVFSINDVFTYWDSQPPYEWIIQGKFYPLFGRHTLKVDAYTTTGEHASDEMEILFFTISYQYGKW